MWPQRLVAVLVTGIAALAVGVSLAAADSCTLDLCFVPARAADRTLSVGNGMIDDYWRDGLQMKSSPTRADQIVDDYWRDGLGRERSTPTVTGPALDDYWRDQPALVVTGSGFAWGDFALGIGVATGSLLALAGLATGLVATRLGRKTSRTELA